MWEGAKEMMLDNLDKQIGPANGPTSKNSSRNMKKASKAAAAPSGGAPPPRAPPLPPPQAAPPLPPPQSSPTHALALPTPSASSTFGQVAAGPAAAPYAGGGGGGGSGGLGGGYGGALGGQMGAGYGGLLSAAGLASGSVGASSHGYCMGPGFGAAHGAHGSGYGVGVGSHSSLAHSHLGLTMPLGGGYNQQHAAASAHGAQHGGGAGAPHGQPPLPYGLHGAPGSSLGGMGMHSVLAGHGAQSGYVAYGSGMAGLGAIPGHLQAQWQQAQQAQHTAQAQAQQMFRSAPQPGGASLNRAGQVHGQHGGQGRPAR